MGEKMGELVNHYELFITVFLTVFIVVFIIYFFINKRKKALIEIQNLRKEGLYKKENDRREQERITKEDKNQFQELVTFFPLKGGSIEFLENHNFANTFHGSKLDDLYRFYYDWNSKFPNSILEEKRYALHASVGEYINLITNSVKNTTNGELALTKNRESLTNQSQTITEKYQSLVLSMQKMLSKDS